MTVGRKQNEFPWTEKSRKTPQDTKEDESYKYLRLKRKGETRSLGVNNGLSNVFGESDRGRKEETGS